MTALARMLIDRVAGVTVVAIDGEIDASNVAELRSGLHDLLDNRATALVVDLTPTRYVDSAGLNLLFELGSELRDRQQRLRLVVDPASQIARMVAICGLEAAEATHATRNAALAAAAA